MVRAIFYMHETSGICAGVCVCNHTYQMEKTAFAVFVLTERMLISLGEFSS